MVRRSARLLKNEPSDPKNDAEEAESQDTQSKKKTGTTKEPKQARAKKSNKSTKRSDESASNEIEPEIENGKIEQDEDTVDRTVSVEQSEHNLKRLSIDPTSSSNAITTTTTTTTTKDADNAAMEVDQAESDGNEMKLETLAVSEGNDGDNESDADGDDDDDDDEVMDNSTTKNRGRRRAQTKRMNYKESSSEAEEEDDDDDEDADNPMFDGMSKAERIAMKAKMNAMQSDYDDAVRKERELKLREIINAFDLNISATVTIDEAGFIYDFCRKHQRDVIESIEDEGEFFLQSMREMMEEKMKLLRAGVALDGGKRKKRRGGGDSESEFDMDEFSDASSSEFSWDSEWTDPEQDRENLLSDDDDGGFVVGNKRRRRRRGGGGGGGRRRRGKDNVFVDDDGREYYAKGRLLLNDALKDTTNFEGWSAARVQAWKNREDRPNAYFYRFNAPDEEQINGALRESEHSGFMQRVLEMGVNFEWGIFSKPIKGRVGYQCSNYWRQMMKDGWVKDPNYWIRADGSFQYKRAKKGSIPDSVRKYSFVVLRDPSNVFAPCPAYHPKRPTDAQLAKYLQHEVQPLTEKEKKGGKKEKKSKSKSKNSKKEKDDDVDDEVEEKKENDEQKSKKKKSKKKEKKDAASTCEENGENSEKKKKKKKSKKKDKESKKEKEDENGEKKEKKKKKKSKKKKEKDAVSTCEENGENKKKKKKKKKDKKDKKTKMSKKKTAAAEHSENSEDKTANETDESQQSLSGKRGRKRKHSGEELQDFAPPQKKRKTGKKKNGGDDDGSGDGDTSEPQTDEKEQSIDEESEQEQEQQRGEDKLEQEQKQELELEQDVDKQKEDVDPFQVLCGMLDPMTSEKIERPAISPYGHVMDYNSWCAVLRNPKTKNQCPFTKQAVTRRALVKLTKENIAEYVDKIKNATQAEIQSLTA